MITVNSGDDDNNMSMKLTVATTEEKELYMQRGCQVNCHKGMTVAEALMHDEFTAYQVLLGCSKTVIGDHAYLKGRLSIKLAGSIPHGKVMMTHPLKPSVPHPWGLQASCTTTEHHQPQWDCRSHSCPQSLQHSHSLNHQKACR